MTSTYNRDYAECPMCHYVDHDIWEYGLSDGESVEHECPNCGVLLRVTAYVSVHYETEVLTNSQREVR